MRVELARRNMKRSELAAQCGLSRQYVSDALNGKVGFAPPGWLKMLDALGLELAVRPKGEQ